MFKEIAYSSELIVSILTIRKHDLREVKKRCSTWSLCLYIHFAPSTQHKKRFGGGLVRDVLSNRFSEGTPFLPLDHKKT
jgi:hypothetical protein